MTAEDTISVPCDHWTGTDFVRAAGLVTAVIRPGPLAVSAARVTCVATAVELADVSKMTSLRAHARRVSGFAHVVHRDDAGAAASTRRSAILLRIRDRHVESASLYSIADCDRLQGRYDHATDLYTQALTIDRALGDADGERVCLAAIAACQAALNPTEVAIEEPTGIRLFLSYRRDGSSHVTGRLSERLRGEFGDDNVFYDVASIELGDRFATIIRERIAAVDVVLVIIGADWNPARLHDEGDYVAMEIAAALAAGKRIIPVLLDGTPMPKPIDLPADLRDLTMLNAARLRRDPDFSGDAAKIIESVRPLETDHE